MSSSKILLVSATKLEISPLAKRLSIPLLTDNSAVAEWAAGSANVDILITGVGQMQMGYHLGRALMKNEYSLAVNLGLAGSFKEKFSIRSVIQVMQEELADLGAEEEKSDIDLFEIGLLKKDAFPFASGVLKSPDVSLTSTKNFAHVNSVTVNKVLGTKASIDKIKNKYDPDVVNMEGAAFFYACLLNGVKCISVRAISDMVGPRDKTKWDIKGAVDSLCDAGAKIFDELT